MLHNKQPPILSGLLNRSVLLAHDASPVGLAGVSVHLTSSGLVVLHVTGMSTSAAKVGGGHWYLHATSVWTRHAFLLLTLHWPKHVTDRCLTSKGVGNLCVEEDRNIVEQIVVYSRD